MPGRTGKLTQQALLNRGPRMVLAQGRTDDGRRLTVIFREDLSCFAARFPTGDFLAKLSDGEYISFRTLAKSFTLNYLLRIGKVMLEN